MFTVLVMIRSTCYTQLILCTTKVPLHHSIHASRKPYDTHKLPPYPTQTSRPSPRTAHPTPRPPHPRHPCRTVLRRGPSKSIHPDQSTAEQSPCCEVFPAESLHSRLTADGIAHEAIYRPSIRTIDSCNSSCSSCLLYTSPSPRD